ncbi:radical SAM protein [Methanofollis formosanus]|uniref:Radical SAM protein n=1 Tax=Methanofollis formosanus TaxID=299308 RepID=A0A8G1A557_9EURY|nr:radical SAM protein [Methanofollis formosanus]QYZ80277.1 radical SAM protein [Methanofollis formosanus]
MLLKETKSLCPICRKVLDAEITEEDGKVWITRTCPDHGEAKNLYWSDAEMYRRFDAYEAIGAGVQNPQREAGPEACPGACGLCSNHHSGTLLANIDLTNRCNLNCDFCFANARACGFVYEPSFDEVIGMMAMLREEKPVPPPAVQFSGGEPTMRDDLPEIIWKAKEMGFSQVQIATNGIKLAKDINYVQELKDVGLSTVYLHFDGVTRETNPILPTSLKAVENCKEIGLGVVLVPTVINGRNDHEVGAILKYAAEHVEVVRGVNFQPVAFTGAASEDDIRRERVTIPDLADRIEEQTEGVIKKEFFYPVPCVIPISDLVEAYTGKPQVRFTTHQHCGAATYVFVEGDRLIPINEMVDVDKFFEAIDRMAVKMQHGGTINKYMSLLEGVKEMSASASKGEVNGTKLWKLLGEALVFQNFDALRDFHWNAIFIGTMHFMDNFNYDVERVQRCCIHYTTPDGRMIPFCTYNSGPVYREEVWKKFAQPLEKNE